MRGRAVGLSLLAATSFTTARLEAKAAQLLQGSNGRGVERRDAHARRAEEQRHKLASQQPDKDVEDLDAAKSRQAPQD